MADQIVSPHRAGPWNPEWLSVRRDGVSASEVAAAAGLSPWDSPLSLYWRKRLGWQSEPTEEMQIGTAVEPAVVQLWQDRCDPHEHVQTVRSGLWCRDGWKLATPDRFVYLTCPECDGEGMLSNRFGDGLYTCPRCKDRDAFGTVGHALAALECKWTGSWSKWGDDGTDEIPVYYRCQVLWQCHVTGVPQWYLAVLGPSGMRVYQGHADDGEIAQLVEIGRRFYQRMIDYDPPPPDEGPASHSIDTLKALHPTVDDIDVELPPDLVDGWRRARRLKQRTEKVCDRYEARARDMLGTGRRMVHDGTTVATRSVFDRTDDMSELDALDVDRRTTDRLNPGRALK